MTTVIATKPHTGALVVGAGPTGLTLACELARRGVPHLLVEASPGPRAGSRGKGLQPRTLEVLEDLAVVDRVVAKGRFAMPVRVTDPDGQVTLGGGAPAAAPPHPDTPYTASLITPQWRLEEMLRERLTELGGHVEFGTELTGFVQTDHGVEATITQDGIPTRTTATWLVGCDGGGSVVRRTAGIDFVGETRESVRMLIADVEVAGLDREAWHMWRHQDGLMSLCPLPSTNLFQYQAGVAPGQDTTLSRDNLQETLRTRSNRDDIRLSEPTWSSLWRANVRLAERYRDQAVLLAGDAAHVHSPAGGQGMNTGIQDAYNLGWKLAAVLGGASAALLDSYEDERRPVAQRVLALSDERLRQTVEDHAIPVTRNADTTQMSISYRGDPLFTDDRDGSSTLRAGDRAPDATGLLTVAGERRWFDLLHSGQFTVLAFGPDRAVVSDRSDVRRFTVTAHPSAPGGIVDTRGHLARAYGATGRTAVLIRPDGYVAVISDTGHPRQIDRYLEWWS